MLNPPRCQRCGAEKKTREGRYCHRCATIKRHADQNRDWKPEETAALIAYAGVCAEISQLQKQINEQKNLAMRLRAGMLKRHKSLAISSKLSYLKCAGVLTDVPRSHVTVKLEAS
jgi:hypothetical protein